MNPDDLIRIAQHLASDGTGAAGGRPNQADLRRAVSTAYYAAFHALAACCADTLVGAVRQNRDPESYRRTYRALQHRPAKSQCQRSEIAQFPNGIRYFVRAFINLQSHRHIADYAPDQDIRFYRSQTIALIAEAEAAIEQLKNTNNQQRKSFATFVLFTKRNP